MKSAFYLFCFALLLILISSCGKPEIRENEKIKIDPLIMEYFGSYGVGSWWEYEIDNSGKIERCEVTFRGIAMNVPESGPPYKEQLILDISSNIKPLLTFSSYAKLENPTINIKYLNSTDGFFLQKKIYFFTHMILSFL